MIRFEQVFKVRVVYKSGYVHDFECTKFKIEYSRGSTSYSYEAADIYNKPLQLGADDIAAVWQIGIRTRLRLGK